MTLNDLLTNKERDKLIAKLSFEEGQKILEELVAKVESGESPLDLAVQSYEVGSDLLKHLRNLLNQAEERVKILRVDGVVAQ